MVVRIAIKVAYFNTYNLVHGFQIQPDVETIFSLLKKALMKSDFIQDEEDKVDYAGRTDHGVNAICQVIAFNLNSKFDTIPDRFLQRINSHLPKYIKCWAFSIVSKEFHPRFDAIERAYSYIYTLHHQEMLDVNLMEDSKKLLIGVHNFVNFAKKDSDLDKYEREVNEIKIKNLDDRIIFSIKAKSFLWQQCRRVFAHLIQIGKKQTDLKYTEKLLYNDGKIIKPTPLPPEFLVLTNISYKNIKFTEDGSIKLKILQILYEDLIENTKKINFLDFVITEFS